jgi:hypothetical protein
MLSSANRFFGRYSYEKTHRICPRPCRTATPGSPSARVRRHQGARGSRSTDTHTFSSNLLNEFRVGWSSIKFFMTSIDYGTNPAQAVGIPGINLGPTTSAMSQIMFNNGGMRNLGAKRQPAAHHQPERHPDLRQRDARHRQAHPEGRRQLHAPFARDSQCRHDRRPLRLQPEPDVELRRHHQRLHRAANTGFDFASFLLGYASNASRTLFDPGTYTELRPEFAAYFQDDIRVTTA